MEEHFKIDMGGKDQNKDHFEASKEQVSKLVTCLDDVNHQTTFQSFIESDLDKGQIKDTILRWLLSKYIERPVV